MKRNINFQLDSQVYKYCNRFLNVISHPFSVQVSAFSREAFSASQIKGPSSNHPLLSFVVHIVHHHKFTTQYSMQANNVEFSLGVFHTLSL